MSDRAAVALLAALAVTLLVGLTAVALARAAWLVAFDTAVLTAGIAVAAWRGRRLR